MAGAERVVRERKRMNPPRGSVLADCSKGVTVSEMKRMLKGKKAK